MAQNQEQLKRLIDIIERFGQEQGNEWFLDELQNRVNKLAKSNKTENHGHELVGLIHTNIESIHKYLKLDVVPLIDYSAIPDANVKVQLFRDCLEMGKYRLGKINENISFDDFCRFAHLQAEELLNYYYSKKDKSITNIILTISKYYNNYNPKQPIKKVFEIDYTVKLIAFYNQYSHYFSSTYKDILIRLKDLRNEQSHRSTYTLEEEDEILNSYHIIMTANIPYRQRTKEENERVRKGELIKFKRASDFDSVYIALENLKELIIKNI